MLAPFVKHAVLFFRSRFFFFLPSLSKIKWASSGLLNSGAHDVANELKYEEQKHRVPSCGALLSAVMAGEPIQLSVSEYARSQQSYHWCPESMKLVTFPL